MTVFQNVRKGLIPARLTVAEVEALQQSGLIAEDDKFELIRGEIVPMAAMKSDDHEIVKRKLVRALVLALPADQGVYVESSIRFDDLTYLEPDICVFPTAFTPRLVRGADLGLVIEIATSSIAFDLGVKAALYAGFGVREYWVVDALRQTIRVHRDPQGGAYADIEEYEAHDMVSALIPGIAIRLDALV